MAVVSITKGLEGLPMLRTFRTRTMHGDSFFRLSGPPVVLSMVPEWRTKLMAAWAMNRQRYMPYCQVCGKEASFDGGLHVWAHAKEANADHVCAMTSHPQAGQAPPEGLRFLVSHLMVPLVWVLHDGTIVVPDLEGPEHVARQQRVVNAFGGSIDPKFL